MKRCCRFPIVFLLHMVACGFAFASPPDGVRIIDWRVFSDNINFDGTINPGENVRYGIIVENGTGVTRDIYAVPSNDSLDEYDFIGVPPGGRDSMEYLPSDPFSYFHFDAPAESTQVTIRFALSTYPAGSWNDSITFPIVPFLTPPRKSIVVHASGMSEWEFDILVLNPSATSDHQYEISLDSIGPIGRKGMTLRDLTTATTLFSRVPVEDAYLHNVPITDGFKVAGGCNFWIFGMQQDSTRWISSFPQWVDGDGLFTYYPNSALNGGVILGGRFESPYGTHDPESSFDLSRAYPIEIRFDSSHPQKAYRLRRLGSHFIQDFVNVPFSAWDARTGNQLTLAWRDQDSSRTWNPSVGYSNVEVIFVYDKPYDSTGTTQFHMPPNAIASEATRGDRANFVYLLSLAVMPGHVLNENPGTIYLRPIYALNESDRFTFNPTILVSAPQGNEPLAFELFQNHPNPFNPSTTIKYELASASMVSIRVYDILGREIKTLVNEIQATGVKSVQWNGLNNGNVSVATGVYFYRIEATNLAGRSTALTQVKKMLLLR